MKPNKVTLKATHTWISPSACVDGRDGSFGFRLVIPAIILYFGIFFGILQMMGCGDESSPTVAGNSQPNWQLTPVPNTPATFAKVASLAPSNDCAHSKIYLAGDNFSWKIVGGLGFDTLDVVSVRENCVIESYVCGTLGYLISGGESSTNGIVNIMLLGHLNPKAGCTSLGQNRCAYSIDGTASLRLDCQLIDPLLTPQL